MVPNSLQYTALVTEDSPTPNDSGAKTEKPVVLSLFIKKRKYYGLVKQSGDFILRLELSGFPSSSGVKNLPATRETWVQSLGQ